MGDDRHLAYNILSWYEIRNKLENTILSQLVSTVTGRGVFYYISIFSIFIVLTFSAQTSFVGFPRVCRLLADNNYLPYFFANKSPRLVFSHGIIILSILAGLILITFDGMTNKLIPLFAVGAFTAFAFSQWGMVSHWIHKDHDLLSIKMVCSITGVITTSIALVVILVSKFIYGAWMDCNYSRACADFHVL